ncbi:hypothetical protein U8335_13860 [Roseiconus lacunae]|uniref:hypothetical protein n=1 Tax=Roseiconus lacunae TaxID=2605694 RepID=UPI00308F0388|nr:hypothetical protein U8335_13860 [Stieleria sp. HD01]
MKVNDIDLMNLKPGRLPDLPEEWEYSGEFRVPSEGDFYLGLSWGGIFKANGRYPLWPGKRAIVISRSS